MGTEPQRASMPYDDRGENGQFERKFEPEEVLRALRERGSLSTTEVADVLECSPRLALGMLRDLEEDDRVTPRAVGNTFLWSETDE